MYVRQWVPTSSQNDDNIDLVTIDAVSIKWVWSWWESKYAKVEVDQWEDKALEVLHQIEEHGQASGILGLLDLSVWTDLARLQTDLTIAHSYHQLLLAYLVRLRPLAILALQNAALNYDPPNLVDDRLGKEGWMREGVPCFLMSWSLLYSELLWYLSLPLEST